jgi:hypothetical protein
MAETSWTGFFLRSIVVYVGWMEEFGGFIDNDIRNSSFERGTKEVV